jgi:hypothetical protein
MTMSLLGWPKTLFWKDFMKPVSAVPAAYNGSHTDCHIDLDIDYTWASPPKRVTPGGDYQLTGVKVTLKVNSLQTWVLAGVPTSKAQATILRHEQGHYNIAGITARDVEQALKALRNSDPDDLEADATTTADGIIASGQTEEETYDDAVNGGTDHGNDVQQQATWVAKIARARSLADLP